MKRHCARFYATKGGPSRHWGWPDPLSVAMRPDPKRIYRVPALAAATTIVWLRFGT